MFWISYESERKYRLPKRTVISSNSSLSMPLKLARGPRWTLPVDLYRMKSLRAVYKKAACVNMIYDVPYQKMLQPDSRWLLDPLPSLMHVCICMYGSAYHISPCSIIRGPRPDRIQAGRLPLSTPRSLTLSLWSQWRECTLHGYSAYH